MTTFPSTRQIQAKWTNAHPRALAVGDERTIATMEILSCRTILRTSDPEATTRFYRDALQLAVAREYPGGTVFYAGNGLIEVAGHMATAIDTPSVDVLWLQVRDSAETETTLRDSGITITREARQEPWGLIELHASDPDGRTLIFVEIPPDHPLRCDTR